MRTPPTDSIEFPFELVIRRRGFFLMSKASYREWLLTDKFEQKMRKQFLHVRPIVVYGWYVKGDDQWYIIEHSYAVN